MGLFSFTDAVTGEGIKIGQECCILVPSEFMYTLSYNGMLYTPSYDGYGNFCDCDVYEVLAIMNRKYLSVSDYPDVDEDMLSAFINGESFAMIEEEYGGSWLRDLGIELFFSSAKLKYPLKVTTVCYGEVTYEDVEGVSEDDINQGC